MLCCTTSVSSPQAHGSPCWPTAPLSETRKFKRLSRRPGKMDIDLEPWLNGLNYRVVLVAGQRREWDEMKEEEVEIERRERQKKGETGGIEGVNQSICLADRFLSLWLFSSIAHPAARWNHTPEHHPGLYAVMSQLASQESAVGGLSLSIQPRLLSGKNANCMLGGKEHTHLEYITPDDPSESVNLARSGRPGSRSQTCSV